MFNFHGVYSDTGFFGLKFFSKSYNKLKTNLRISSVKLTLFNSILVVKNLNFLFKSIVSNHNQLTLLMRKSINVFVNFTYETLHMSH